MVAAELDDERDRRTRKRSRTPREEDAALGEATHSRSDKRAAPDSSALGMNPRAPLRSTSGPKSEPSRLETRTTAGPAPPYVRRAATSKPSRSGRCTSRRTSCGKSSAAARSADAPPEASPTTSQPP